MSNNKRNPYEEDATGEIISWVIIFILIIAVFPLGLYLLWRKSKRREYERSSADEDQGSFYSDTSSANNSNKRASSSVDDAISEVTRDIEEVVREVSTEAAGVVKTIRAELNDVFSLFRDESPEQKSRQKQQPQSEQKHQPQSGTSENRRTAHVDFSEQSTQTANSRQTDMQKNKSGKSLNRIISVALLFIAAVFFAVGSLGLIRSIIGTDTVIGAVYFLIGAVATLIASGIYSGKTYRSKKMSEPSAAQHTATNSTNTFESAEHAQEKERGESFMAIMISLRELKHSIADISIFQKAEKIEELTANIFKIVEETPSKRPRIDRFLSYYLPTTTKLLRTYASFEKQGVKGENITKAKEKIARTLDGLITGFELQLDRLFEADVMDIAAEIKVLENLMRQDGLSAEKGDFSN